MDFYEIRYRSVSCGKVVLETEITHLRGQLDIYRTLQVYLLILVQFGTMPLSYCDSRESLAVKFVLDSRE